MTLWEITGCQVEATFRMRPESKSVTDSSLVSSRLKQLEGSVLVSVSGTMSR